MMHAATLAASAVIGVFVAVGTIAPAHQPSGHLQAGQARSGTVPAADDRSGVPPTVPVDPQAREIAAVFIRTAVARRNLGTAYPLAGPWIRQDISLAEWKTGTIPVVPYPARPVAPSQLHVDFSHATEVQFRVVLHPRAGAKAGPAAFEIALIKSGGSWLVNVWAPTTVPPVPAP
jgi:hypothetical protein